MNLAVTCAELNLSQLAKSYYSTAVEMHIANDISQRVLNTIVPLPPPPPDASFRVKLSTLERLATFSTQIDHAPEDPRNYRERCRLFEDLENIPLALRDAIRWTECDPESVDAWATRARLHHLIGDPERMLECFSRVHELNGTAELCSQFSKFSPFARFDTEFPFHFFYELLLPYDVGDLASRHPIVPHILASFYCCFRRPLYQMTSLLQMDVPVLRAWLDGDDVRDYDPKSPRELEHLMPEQFLVHCDPDDAELMRLIDVGTELGDYLCANTAPLRHKLCMAFAAIEISQVVKKWLQGTSGIVPHFELVMSIIISWIRLSNPSLAAGPRAVKVEATTLLLERGSAFCVSKTIHDLAFRKLKEAVAAELPQELSQRVMAADNLGRILGRTNGDIWVNMKSSTARLYAKRRAFGAVDFGFDFKESIEEKVVLNSGLIALWTRMMLEFRNGDITMRLLEFFYEWLIARPIVAPEGAFGYIILAALLNVLSLTIAAPLRNSNEIEFEALLAPDCQTFLQTFRTDGIVLKPAPDYPSVEEHMPNLHVRLYVLKKYQCCCSDHRQYEAINIDQCEQQSSAVVK
jgi:hypothetical protein